MMTSSFGMLHEALAGFLSCVMILALLVVTPFCQDAVATILRPVPKGVQHFLRDAESGWKLFSAFWIVCGGAGMFIKDRRTFALHFRAGQTSYRYSKTSGDVLDFYHARSDKLLNSQGQPPVLVWVHGGGWAHGHRAQFRVLAMRLTRVGFSVAVVGYTEVQYPRATAVQQSVQVGAALDWTVANAASLGGDPDRVFALAHSSGAHLLMLWLLHFGAQRKQAPAGVLAGCIVLSGVYDLEQQYQHEVLRQVGEFSTLNPACGGTAASRAAVSPDVFLQRHLAGDVPCECKKCPSSGGPSPDLLQVQLDSLPRRIIIAHGKTDKTIPSVQSVQLYEKLQRVLSQRNRSESVCDLHILERCNHNAELIKIMLGDDESAVVPLLVDMAMPPRRSERLAKGR